MELWYLKVWNGRFAIHKDLYDPIEGEKARFANLDYKNWT